MALKLITGPTEEPVSIEEAIAHLRSGSVDDFVEDYGFLAGRLAVARKHCENFLNCALLTQTWDLYLDEFPDDDSHIEIPLPPLQSVTWLKYKETAGTLTEWDSTNYIVDIVSEPGRIALAYGISWPSTYDEIQAVQIRFVCGYQTASDVPDNIKQAILLKLTDLWEHRGDDAVSEEIERAVENLLWYDRIVPI